MANFTKFEGTVSKHSIRITDAPQINNIYGYVDPRTPEHTADLSDNITFTIVGSGLTVRQQGIDDMTTLFKTKAAQDLAKAVEIEAEYSDVAYEIKEFKVKTDDL